MLDARESPSISHTSIDIVNKGLVEIYCCDRFNLLDDDTCRKAISATDLKYVLTPGKHLCHELVPRKRKSQPLGVIEIRPACHEAKALASTLLNLADWFLVLFFTFGR